MWNIFKVTWFVFTQLGAKTIQAVCKHKTTPSVTTSLWIHTLQYVLPSINTLSSKNKALPIETSVFWKYLSWQEVVSNKMDIQMGTSAPRPIYQLCPCEWPLYNSVLQPWKHQTGEISVFEHPLINVTSGVQLLSQDTNCHRFKSYHKEVRSHIAVEVLHNIL